MVAKTFGLGVASAYAKAVKENPEWADNGHYVVLQSYKPNREDSFKRVLGVMYRHDLLCVASEEQYEELKERYNATTTQVKLNGKDIEFLNVSTKKLNTGELYMYLRQSPDFEPCVPVRHNNLFYLLFSAHIS